MYFLIVLEGTEWYGIGLFIPTIYSTMISNTITLSVWNDSDIIV